MNWHFENPLWLWGLAVIPFAWLVFIYCRPSHSLKKLEKFIDSHLLPYLLTQDQPAGHTWWKMGCVWSLIWFCLVLAFAGPRWNFREIEAHSKDQSVVILLDLSESMNAADVKPSRLIRAKQKIEDLLNLSEGVKIGLVAFAADPHMIAPLTDDKETIRRLLPSLTTELVYVQGSRLSPALQMAARMLGESGQNKAIVLLSDGGFEDSSAIGEAKKIASQEGKQIPIYAIGVGTTEGAVLKDNTGNLLKKNGTPIFSKLARERLEEIGKMGQGGYFEENYSLENGSNLQESVLLDKLAKAGEVLETGKKDRIWEEGFFVFLLPVIPLFLWSFRKRGIFFVCLLPLFTLDAGLKDYFHNSEQQGKLLFEAENYPSAADQFQDFYRKGVAHYKAGNFPEAEKMFRESFREEVALEAGYNLGNALAMQQKWKEAATAYEDVLTKWPTHQKTKENLEIVKKILDQQKQENQNPSDSSEDQKNENSSSEEDQKNQQKNNNSDSEREEGSQNEQDNQEEEAVEKGEENQQEEASEPTTSEGEESALDDKEKDQDADLWLNRIKNDPKQFLKNKFYIESKRNGTEEGMDPW